MQFLALIKNKMYTEFNYFLYNVISKLVLTKFENLNLQFSKNHFLFLITS